MSKFRVTHRNISYKVKAKDAAEAVRKVEKIHDNNFEDFLEHFDVFGVTYKEVPNDRSNGVAYQIKYKNYATGQEIREKAVKEFGKHVISSKTGEIVVGDSSIRDDRLSPMTYKKLKEFGYTSQQWKNWNQEQANKVIASRMNKQQPKQSQKKEGNAANSKKAGNAVNSKNNPTKSIQSSAESKEIDKFRKEAESDNWGVRSGVASNKNTPPEILKKLSNDNIDWVRRDVAINPSTPLETLEKLSNDEEVSVRSGVAENRNIPLEMLEKLSNDEGGWVRLNVAENKNISPEIIEKLSNDKEYQVRGAIAKNPKTPLEILEKLSNDKSGDVRENIAKNPKTPLEILEKLSNDKSGDVRSSVAENPNANKKILNKVEELNKVEKNKYHNTLMKKLIGKPSGNVSGDVEDIFNKPFGKKYDGDYFDIQDIEEAVKKMYPDHDIAVVGNYGFGEDDEDTYKDYKKVVNWCNKNGYDYKFVNANRDVEDFEGDHWDIPAGKALVISKKGEKQGKVRKALGSLLDGE